MITIALSAFVAAANPSDVAEHHTIDAGLVTYDVVAHIDAKPGAVLAAARDLCAPANQRMPARYFRDVDVDAVHPQSVDDLTPLASIDCAQASRLDRFYGVIQSPLSNVLVRYEAHGLTLTSTQILGGEGKEAFAIIPLDDGNTSLAIHGTMRVPTFIPTFVLERMMPPADEQIADLRRRSALRN
jgi:hypothetical protein